VNSVNWVSHNLDGDGSKRAYVKIVSAEAKDKGSLCHFEENGTSTLKLLRALHH
jgi:hypothetical protein